MAPAIGLYLELWLGNARSPDQALSPRPAEGDPPASVARSGEAGPQLPTPLRQAGRAEGRSRRSPTPPPLARRAHSWAQPRAPRPGPRLPTSGQPGSSPPHHMAAPATSSRRKPEAAAAPPPPPFTGRRSVASAFLPRRARSGTCWARAGLHPSGGGARSPRGASTP